ncbi:hypothetical protein, conserved, partial [Eimeria maxima]
MISDDSGSSSESEAAADLLDAVLGTSNNSFKNVKTEAPEGVSGACSSPQRDRHKKKENKKEEDTSEQGDTLLQPYKGLKLELKGLPLEVGPPSCSKSTDQQGDLLRLQPHQKLLRLSVDGDPAADPA